MNHLARNDADERERDKRKDAERRRDFLNVIRSLGGVLAATRSTLRFSAAFAPPRFSL